MDIELIGVKDVDDNIIEFNAIIRTKREFKEFPQLMNKLRDRKRFLVYLEEKGNIVEHEWRKDKEIENHYYFHCYRTLEEDWNEWEKAWIYCPYCGQKITEEEV